MSTGVQRKGGGNIRSLLQRVGVPKHGYNRHLMPSYQNHLSHKCQVPQARNTASSLANIGWNLLRKRSPYPIKRGKSLVLRDLFSFIQVNEREKIAQNQ